MWRRHVTVSITTMSFFAPAHAARVPIALLSTITSTISTNVAPWHVSCVAPEHVDTRVGVVDIRLPWPRTFSQPPCELRLHLLQIIIKNIVIIFYHESSSSLDLAGLTYRVIVYGITDGVSIQWESGSDLRVIFYWSFLGKMFRIFVTCQYEYIHDKYCCQRTKMIRDWQKLTNNENSRWFGLRNARMAH